MKRLNKEKNAIQVRIHQRRWWISLCRQRDQHWRKITGNKRGPVEQTVIKTPSVLSISRNGKATLEFFEQLKSVALLQCKKVLSKGRWYPKQLHIDLSTISTISVPTAVILSAELHRWSILKDIVLQPKKLSAWSPRVRHLLVELGCFRLLGIPRRATKDMFDADELSIQFE